MFFDDIIFTDNYEVKRNNNTFGVTEGFMLGNMFKDEYDAYKNYKVQRLNATNEKGALLLMIYEFDFAINDLSLKLDLNPNDKELYELFRKFTMEEKRLVTMYENKYGPLELCESDYENYEWYKGKWPFEGGNI